MAIAVALAGIVAGYLVYARHKAKAIEPAILEQAWMYDQAVTAFMGGPGPQASRRWRGSTAPSSTAR